jgi:hypothetical protein
MFVHPGEQIFDQLFSKRVLCRMMKSRLPGHDNYQGRDLPTGNQPISRLTNAQIIPLLITRRSSVEQVKCW